ncbi:related to ADH7-NADP(H)-dependent alcohol dehydrogenase [Ramularia collo-cygni]|uniref:Related to ADH7-NADP(H)-dependent alcohol dehydrogenase n=1 Tax=Ramularia collo-cygni TaxID=112498 RepID=A0A2D3UMB0_9PEZI|nr:related to ADH7-NADP(H)-dependent alcohol dehydrogenase [Ramularia collo-cygni]CZT15051.1 related to ADH7-NADP(H)-dependent alcohol dehydrogenase [Ramularia collo-cygni]
MYSFQSPQEQAKHTLRTYHFSPENSSYSLQTTELPIPPTSVLIKTTHSGICHTDIHAKPSGCGLGHEGIGHIAALGSSIVSFQVGDRVGWGWLHTSCKQCKTCKSGYPQYCHQARGFAFTDTDQGSMSTARIIDVDLIVRIPDEIPSLYAAPLMCAGASTFEALYAAGVSADSHVGVVGVGGLGHMATLFAKAMGCEVTAISRTEGKREDARALGADHFILSSPNMKMGDKGEGIDVLLITSAAVPDFKSFLPLLARRATIVLMTIQGDSIEVPYMDFVLPGHRMVASTECGRENWKRMLEFVAEKGIVPWVEEFEISDKGIETAFERLEGGKMRYRGVLSWRE